MLVCGETHGRNSLTGKMMVGLHRALDELTLDSAKQYKDCCALILHGAGSSFCSGMDFNLAKSIQTPEEGELMNIFMTSVLRRLR